MRIFRLGRALRCSFCNKSQEQVEKLIASPAELAQVYICNEFVDVCHKILQDEKKVVENKTGGANQGKAASSNFVDWITGRIFGKHRNQGNSMAIGRPLYQ